VEEIRKLKSNLRLLKGHLREWSGAKATHYDLPSVAEDSTIISYHALHHVKKYSTNLLTSIQCSGGKSSQDTAPQISQGNRFCSKTPCHVCSRVKLQFSCNQFFAFAACLKHLLLACREPFLKIKKDSGQTGTTKLQTQAQ
jgi:hypothetical protein